MATVLAPSAFTSTTDVLGPVTKEALLAQKQLLAKEIAEQEAAKLMIDRRIEANRAKLTQAVEAVAIFEHQERIARREERNEEIDRFYTEQVDESSLSRVEADLTISALGIDRFDADPTRGYRKVTIDYPVSNEAGNSVFVRETFNVPTDSEGVAFMKNLLAMRGSISLPNMKLEEGYSNTTDEHDVEDIFQELDRYTWPVEGEHTYATQLSVNVLTARDSNNAPYFVVPRSAAKLRSMTEDTAIFDLSDPAFKPLVEGGTVDVLRNPPQPKVELPQPEPKRSFFSRFLGSNS